MLKSQIMLQVHKVALSRGSSVPLVCFAIDEEKKPVRI